MTKLLSLAELHVRDAAFCLFTWLTKILCVYSNHSHKALQMMNKYRIGRIAEPWVNLTPPIRGGIYRDNTEDAQYKPDAKMATTLAAVGVLAQSL